MKNLHQAIRKGLKIDHEKGRFRGYLAKTVQRAVRDFKRTNHRMRADSTRIVDSASERETPTADLAALERIERLRYCIVCLRESADVRRRDVEAFERYALHGEKAEHVAKYFGISTGRLYGIRSEMLDRVRILMSRLDLELGEV